jgi:hypothetical protein
MPPAKAQRRQVYEEKDEISYKWFPPLLCGLCVPSTSLMTCFAGDYSGEAHLYLS